MPLNLPETIRITKMHGSGNDFVLIDEFKSEVVPESSKSGFAKAVCHRRFGIGADGILFVQPSAIANAKLRYFNSDGSEAEMCGNGIACVSRYMVEEGYAGKKLRIETLAGIFELFVSVENAYWVKVNMGKPRLRLRDNEVWKEIFEVDGKPYEVYAVEAGVPHAVVFADNLDLDILRVARKIRHSPLFPQGTNVNFVKVLSTKEIHLRTYERGVEGETLSCGTGSVASVALAYKLGLIQDSVKVVTKGGVLKVEIGESAYMTCKAKRVFDGTLRITEL